MLGATFKSVMVDIRPELHVPEPPQPPSAERNRQTEVLVEQVLSSRLTPQGILDLRTAQGNVDLSFGRLRLFRQLDDPAHLNEDHPREPHYHIGFRHESDAKIIEANVAYSLDSAKTTPLSADFSNHSASYRENSIELPGAAELEKATSFLKSAGVLPAAS